MMWRKRKRRQWAYWVKYQQRAVNNSVDRSISMSPSDDDWRRNKYVWAPAKKRTPTALTGMILGKAHTHTYIYRYAAFKAAVVAAGNSDGGAAHFLSPCAPIFHSIAIFIFFAAVIWDGEHAHCTHTCMQRVINQTTVTHLFHSLPPLSYVIFSIHFFFTSLSFFFLFLFFFCFCFFPLP